MTETKGAAVQLSDSSKALDFRCCSQDRRGGDGLHAGIYLLAAMAPSSLAFANVSTFCGKLACMH